MGQLLRLPLDETVFARLTQRERDANTAAEWAEAVAEAQRIIDDPRGYTDAQLREICGAYMASGAGGVHYLRADQHIYAINMREIQARNRQKILIPREPDEPLWRDVIAGGVAVIAWGVAVIAFGWAVLSLVLA